MRTLTQIQDAKDKYCNTAERGYNFKLRNEQTENLSLAALSLRDVMVSALYHSRSFSKAWEIAAIKDKRYRSNDFRKQ